MLEVETGDGTDLEACLEVTAAISHLLIPVASLLLSHTFPCIRLNLVLIRAFRASRISEGNKSTTVTADSEDC